jgi:transcription elongation factor Elf1
MGRRKRKKIVYRPNKTPPKVFTCPKCGHKTIKAKMRHKDQRVLIRCGHCAIEQEVSKNQLTEPVDAFGEFIDIYYKDQEFERLTRREEKLIEKEQYNELANVYSLLADIAQINANKFLEDHEINKDPEDLDYAEKWKDDSSNYKENERVLRERLASGELIDAILEEEVYEEEENNPFDDSQTKVSDKPKKGVNMEEVLGDIGFLEF